MSRVGKTLLFCMVVLTVVVFVAPPLLYYKRLEHVKHLQSAVAGQGCSLSIDLQGDYSLELIGSAANDESIAQIVPQLMSLPNGFTLLGPGESRGLYVKVNDSPVTDRGMVLLCELPIDLIHLENVPGLTGRSVDALSALSNPYAMILGYAPFSDKQISKLRSHKPNTYLESSMKNK